MGLDDLELVMSIEEKFGISILDEEAQEVTTPRRLTDLVLGKLKVNSSASCLSQRAFHLLRRKAMEDFSVPRGIVRPDTPLDRVVPLAKRRAHWAQWQSSVGAANWPDLCRSNLLFGLLVAVALIASVYVWFLLREATASSFLAYTGAAFAAASFGWLEAIATRPWRREFRDGYSNVGELAQFLVARNPDLIQDGTHGWTREQVWCVIRDLIIEQTGTTDFNEDSHFYKDIFK